MQPMFTAPRQHSRQYARVAETGGTSPRQRRQADLQPAQQRAHDARRPASPCWRRARRACTPSDRHRSGGPAHHRLPAHRRQLGSCHWSRAGIVATSIRAWAAGVSEIAVDDDGNGHAFELAVSAGRAVATLVRRPAARLAGAMTCCGSLWIDGDLQRLAASSTRGLASWLTAGARGEPRAPKPSRARAGLA